MNIPSGNPTRLSAWTRLAAATALAMGLLSGTASLADPAPSVPPAELHKLGFVLPGEVNLAADGYAKLLVALYVPGNQTDLNLDRCPKNGIWGIDVTNITSGDKHTTFGVQVTDPNVAAPVNLNPLDFTKTASGFLGFSSDCHLKVDVIRYVSPVYFVRKSENQQFTIAPTYEVTKALNATLQSDLNTLLGATSALAGVTAAAAAPYLSAIKTNLANAKTDTASSFIQHPTILSGPVQAAYTWSVPGAIKGTKTAPPQDLILIAQLLPVATIVPTPTGGVWTPGAVLNSAFNVNVPALPAATDGTLGGYIAAKAPAALLSYANATTDDGANIACGAIDQAIDQIGLSDRDAALALWAEAKQRVVTAKATDAAVDNMSCLANAWTFLTAAGIQKKDIPPPAKPPGVAPRVAQMKVTTDINNAFALFFVSPLWTDQMLYADQILGYPVQYNDEDGALMRQSLKIANADAVLVNEFNRDQPILAQVGCYVYFDINSDTTGFASSVGAHSMMMAIGGVGSNGSPSAGKEVALMITFAEAPGGDNPKIAQIDVLTTLPPATRRAMLTQLNGATQCPSGYRPRMLFGG